MWLSCTVEESVKDGIKSFIIANRVFRLGVVECGKVKGFVEKGFIFETVCYIQLKSKSNLKF